MAGLASAETIASSALENEIAKAVAEGKGWKDGEREEYLKKVSEEDHPMFTEKLEVRQSKEWGGGGLRGEER